MITSYVASQWQQDARASVYNSWLVQNAVQPTKRARPSAQPTAVPRTHCDMQMHAQFGLATLPLPQLIP
jgi:hypothetical protein